MRCSSSLRHVRFHVKSRCSPRRGCRRGERLGKGNARRKIWMPYGCLGARGRPLLPMQRRASLKRARVAMPKGARAWAGRDSYLEMKMNGRSGGSALIDHRHARAALQRATRRPGGGWGGGRAGEGHTSGKAGSSAPRVCAPNAGERRTKGARRRALSTPAFLSRTNRLGAAVGEPCGMRAAASAQGRSRPRGPRRATACAARAQASDAGSVERRSAIGAAAPSLSSQLVWAEFWRLTHVLPPRDLLAMCGGKGHTRGCQWSRDRSISITLCPCEPRRTIQGHSASTNTPPCSA